MAKPTYLVTVARKGEEERFRDFWERGVRRDAAGEALTAERVGFVEPVRASNRREAMMLVRARFPGHPIGPRILKQMRRRAFADSIDR